LQRFTGGASTMRRTGSMISPFRTFLDLVFVGLALWLQWMLLRWIIEGAARSWAPGVRGMLRGAFWVSCVWLTGSAAYGIALASSQFPALVWLDWIRGASIAWAICTSGLFAIVWLWKRGPAFDPGRRRLLAGAALATPAAITGAGVFIERRDFQVVEQTIEVPGLAPGLDGLRIAHISDIHLGPFLEERDLRRVVEMANETRPHLAAVTGDLITARPDRLSDCIRVLKGLRSDAGVAGCLGNHESVARCEARVKDEGARAGLEFLRGESLRFRFGDAALNVAGVDFQRRSEPYLAGAERLWRDGDFNLLLSHQPDVFPVAAAQGWDLTLAGHTHGGQITPGFLTQYANVARLFTPFVYGSYRMAGSALYVTRGIGTVTVPARIGAPPEIALIRLCAT